MTQEIGERTIGDFDGFANGKARFEFGSGLSDEFLDGGNLFFGEGSGLVAGADKAGDTLGGTDSQPRVVVEDHFEKHIPGKDLFFDGRFLAGFDVNFVLSGDKNFEDFVFYLHGFDTLDQSLGNFGFMA